MRSAAARALDDRMQPSYLTLLAVHLSGKRAHSRLLALDLVAQMDDPSVRLLVASRLGDSTAKVAIRSAELLAGLACVDWVTWFGEPTPRAILGELRPDIYAKGGDWSLSLLRRQDLPPGVDIEVRRLRQIPRARTSQIVEKVLREGR